MNVDGCALQCYELLRPVPLQEIPEHVEERRLHRWHQQMPIDQVPTYRLIRELDNTTAPCILYVFYYLYISDVGPTSLTTRRWLRDNLFVDDATRLISIIIFFFFGLFVWFLSHSVPHYSEPTRRGRLSRYFSCRFGLESRLASPACLGPTRQSYVWRATFSFNLISRFSLVLFCLFFFSPPLVEFWRHLQRHRNSIRIGWLQAAPFYWDFYKAMNISVPICSSHPNPLFISHHIPIWELI